MALQDSPFPRDAGIPDRLASRDVTGLLSAARSAMSRGLILEPAKTEDLVTRFGLESREELGLHLLPLAREIAAPPISDFHVGAVGVATDGTVILGGNLEWPGTNLGFTLHGEGFVAIRAHHLGLRLATLAITEAHPCAHCRQCLAEHASGETLMIVDPHGHRLSLSDLYPWPFSPTALGQPGALPEKTLPVTITGHCPEPVRDLLTAEAGRAHAPYSGSVSALVLDTGQLSVCGFVIESVAFNPTIQPVMSAFVQLIANGGRPSDVRQAWLLQRGGSVDYAAPTADLLGKVAPGAALHLLDWPA
ncbi:cytidine deaminase [Pelagovum pacificum]|uniref:Cytidine deaminase n=1 Tax=Pelagovum pacificum TaxID=2588711 RepID=A0A5C5GCY2_9RHOB|nr:cytidine deaminase [Pelagovum pacificum]QQA44213.1 cytidine deaminase [Pelagovum pacificum]TNY32665.1 cytidine deaminase [Pelagovum pacificum]